MKRHEKQRPKWYPYAGACTVGLICYVLLSLLTAKLILNEVIPQDYASAALCISAGISAWMSGLMLHTKKERRPIQGLLIGLLFAILILLIKGICNPDAEWTLYTSLSCSLCVLCSFISSCIFHKRNNKTSKRKRNYSTKNNA